MIGKKRYAGLKIESLGDKPKLETKGLQLVRRDTVPMAREVSAAVLNAFLIDRSVDAAIECARKAISDLVFDNVPLSSLILSKQLRGNYANPQSQPHLCVATKKKQRTGEVTPSGTRVQYVFVRAPELMDELLAARAECPDYAVEHGLKPDITYYLHNQIMTPILTLLEPMVANARDLLLNDECIRDRIRQLETDLRAETTVAQRIKKNTTNRQREITTFFSKKIKTN